MGDFIPLSSDKSGDNNKKRKHHHKERSASSGKSSSDRDRERPQPNVKHEAKDPKLKDRICKYLEENRHKQYIDMQDMSKNLHTRYPEYNRKKYKAFQEICEAGFDYLQKTAAAAAASATPPSPPPPTFAVSDSSAAAAQHLSESTKTSSDDESTQSKTKKKKSDKIVADETTVPVDTYSVVKMVTAEASKTTSNETPKAVSLQETARSVATELPKTAPTPIESQAVVIKIVAPNEVKTPSETIGTLSTVCTPNILAVETSKLSRAAETKDPQLETPKRFTPLPIPKPFLSPSQKVPTKTVIDLTDGEDDVLTEMRQNGLSTKSSRKSSRAPSPVTASIKKSLLGRKKAPDFEVQQSNITFSQLGGVDKVLIKICKLLIHLKHPEVYQHIGVTPARGILLHGPPGCGKTLLANAIAGELNLPILKLAATEIVSGISGESESRLRDLFDQAMAAAPCLLFIDEIDAITQRRDQSNKGMESRIVGQLLACMDDLNTKGNEKEGQVVVIGATNRPDVLDPALRRAGRFESEIPIGIPDENSRKQILDIMSRDLNVAPTFDMRQLARMTPGYVGADLASLLREAAINAVNRILYQLQPSQGSADSRLQLTDLLAWLSDNSPVPDSTLSAVQIDLSDFEKALKTVQPSSMREGFATVPNVTWSDVGALDDIREELEVSILAPVNYPELTEALGLEAPTGILLCGPPGCGKTLLAKAVANQAGINFISVKGPELLNMYVGESERAVRQVFQRAKNSAPCVIFFDELDSLAPRRSGSGDSSGASRVVNQLLTEMDGVEGRKGVYVMAATNRLDIIDPAVLRPGRLQKILHVDLPSCVDRVSILKAITKRRPLLAPDVDYVTLANDWRCDGYSGADLSALVTEAAMAAFKEHITRAARKSSLEPVPLSSEVRVFWRHFDLAFDKVKPSVTGKDKQHYETLKRKQQGGFNEKAGSVKDPPEKIAKLIPDQKLDDIKGLAAATTSIVQPDVNLDVTQPDEASNEITMEDEELPETEMLGVANAPKIPRYLEKMEVRIKDSSLSRAGCEGFVTCIIPPDACLVQIKGDGNEEVQVPVSDLEPFIPEPGDSAKILVSGESEDVVQVIDYYSNPDYEEPDEENVTVEFENGDIKIVPLDQLCKIVR